MPDRVLPSIPGYTLTAQLHLGGRTAVYQAISDRDGKAVIIKTLRASHPSLSELSRFRNQYVIAKNLAILGIVKPLALVPWQHSDALIVEDVGGISLRNYLQTHGQLNVGQVLAIGLQLADSLHHLSQHRVLHKDLNPANILIHPDTHQIWLVDFGLASLLPKECQALQSPYILEGTLAYIAPEQTGRMNRDIDYRTDFYSLGVSLYELLTGELPFQTNDPMELIHCHIAKVPRSPSEVSHAIPQPLADIVLKLMAKNAEDRYQSALGLTHDLQQCLSQWDASGQIEPFELGQEDRSDRFLIPEKLYGREADVRCLLDAFDRVSQGATELMLVAGYSGVGKTAVVSEIHKPITAKKGYFIKGKFDQFQRNVPFSAFVQVLQDLVKQLLSEPDATLQTWRLRILDALEEKAQVIIDLIPELEWITGPQPPVPELTGMATQNRFNLLLQRFIRVFATAEHPLTIFLDDLQWADIASLQLMQVLVTETQTSHLLVLGAYRDNEVFPAHPLMLTLTELAQAGVTTQTITLQPLHLNSLNQLISDLLHSPAPVVEPLTELVMQKTQGNPFFAIQFLNVLYQEELITFDANAKHWQCDITQVRAAALTDDAIALMASQLQKLPPDTQEILQLAACIGNQFDLDTLAIVSELSAEDVATALWKALQAGLVLPTSQTYKFFQLPGALPIENKVNPSYRFLHDRVQQGAYNLISEEQKLATHAIIGRQLWQNLSASKLEEKLFTTINHLNISKSLITNPSEKITIAKLNFRASQKAKLSVAYAASCNYARIGKELLNGFTGQDHYSLWHDLSIAEIESEFLLGNLSIAEMLAGKVLDQSQTLLDRVRVCELQILFEINKNCMTEAISLAIDLLALLDIHFLKEDRAIHARTQTLHQEVALTTAEIADLENLDSLSDPGKLAAIRVLTNASSAAYIASPLLYPTFVLQTVRYCLQYGNSALSASAYSWHGALLCGIYDEIEAGYEFGKLSLKLLEKFKANSLIAKVTNMFNVFIRPWKEPIRNSVTDLPNAIQGGFDNGDIEYALYAAVHYCNYLFYAGESLNVVSQSQARYLSTVIKAQYGFQEGFLRINQQVVANLLNQETEPQGLQGAYFDRAAYLPQWEQKNTVFLLLCLYEAQTRLAFLFGDYSAAVAFGEKGCQYQQAAKGTLYAVEHSFYYSLSLLTQASLTPVQLSYVESSQQQLQTLANFAPVNFQHKHDLIAAERERVSRDRAMNLYDRAIHGAKENGFIHEAALANERAAQFYLDWGKEKIAAVYLQEAYFYYGQWGAKAKTIDLETRYAPLLQPILRQATVIDSLATLHSIAPLHLSTHSSTDSAQISTVTLNTALDLEAILKSSRALSESIDLSELLKKLASIMLQTSGAERLALFLPATDDIWQVRVIATPETSQLVSVPLTSHPDFPVRLIQSVQRTQEILAVDALDQSLPIVDPYLQQHSHRSVLCLPLLHQSNLIGLLYLEHHSVAGVFSRDRLTILNFLASQAAISLENALLNQTLEQKLEVQTTKREESELRLRNMVNKVPGVVFQARMQTDGTESYIYVSPNCQNLYEVAAEAVMVGRYSLRDFEYAEDKFSLDRYRDELAHTLQPFDREFRIVTPSGTLKWVHAHSHPSRLQDGSILWDGVILDISDRKAAEQALTRKQSHLTALLNHIPHIAWIKDEESRFIAVNQPFASACDTPIEKLVGKTDYDLWPTELAEAYHHDDLQVLHSGQRKVVEERIALADGTLGWLETTKTPFHDAQGQLAGTVGIAANITERKQAERLLSDYNFALEQQVEERTQALQKSEANLLKAQQVAGVGNWEFDIASQTITWSPEMFRMYGLEPTTCAPSYPEYLQMLPDETRRQIQQYVERAITEGIPYTIEYSLTQADGSVSHHECRAEVERDCQGRIVRLFGTALNITNRKQAELALQNLVAGTSATIGRDFFPALVSHISTALDVPIALVTQFADRELQSLALIIDGELQPSSTCALPETPCHELVVNYSYYCPSSVSEHFPHHPFCDKGAESYLGVALRDRQGQVLGSLCIFDRQPLQDPERAKQILKVFGDRAAAELERQRAENALQNLIEGTAALTGPDFFPALVQHIAIALEASHAFVTEVVDEGARLHFLAAWADGQHLPSQTVDAMGTTCFHTLGSGSYHCEHNVTACFPDHPGLASMQVESYVGVALQDRDGQAIGTLCILARHPIVDPKNAEQILRVFGARAAAEIERQRAERAMEQLNQELEIRVRDRTAQLAASEERLQTLFNKAADAVFLLGEAGFIDCNQAAVKLFQYSSKAELLALLPSQISPEKQPDGQLSSVKARRIIQEALQRHSYKFEWVHQRANGEDFWAEVTLTSIKYQDEVIFHCIARDISTQKLLEREQTQLISVLEATPDFIGIANTRGEILWHNKRLRDLRKDLGNPGEHRLISDCHPDWVNEIILNEALPTAIRLGSWSGELALLDGQGNEIPVSQVIIAHKTDAGDVETFSTVMRDIRDRKAAEASLRISESKFRTLLSNLDGVVYRCLNDEAWTMVFMSDAITALSGYPASEFIDNSKRTYASIVHPDDITRVTDSVARGLELRESFTLEYRIIHQDNSVRWVTEKGKGIFGHDGELLCLEGVILDISDRKTAELALQESQEQFRRMTENVPGMIYRYIIPADGRQAFTYVSAQVREFFELEPDAVTQNADLIWERIHSDDVSRLQDEILSNTELLQPFNSEFRLSLPQRGLRWVQINSQVEQLDTGDIIWDGVLIDISERKQLEQEQRRLSTILEATPDWIVILNSLGAIVWCNQPLVELRPDLDVREHPHYSNYYSEWASQFIDKEGLQQAELHGSWSGELELLDAEGNEIPVSMVLIAHKAPNGSIMNFSAIMRDLRERIAIEDSLRESDAKFRNLISNLDGVVYRCQNNAAWTMEFMSDAIATLSGYPASDFINDRNRTYASVIHPDDRELVARVIDCGLAHREPFSMEYRVIHRDGSVRWVTEKGKGVFTADGWPLYLEGVIFDTSDRKTTEQALIQQQTHLQALLNNIPHLTWLKDAEGKYIAANKSYRTICGIDADDIVGKTDLDLWPTELARSYQEDDAEILASGQRKVIIEQFSRSDGLGWIETTKTPFKDEQGNWAGTVGIAADITDLKAAEAALRLSEARAKAAFEQAAVGIAEYSLQRNSITQVNNRFCEMLGYTRSELLDLTVASLTHPDDRLESKVYINKLYSREIDSFTIEKRYIRKDGSIVWAATTVSLIDLPGEEAQSSLAIIKDISDRKAAEKSLQLTKFAVDKTGLGIFWIRKDGLFLDVNESACTNLGYSYDELKELYVWDITPNFPSHGWASHWEEIRQKSFLRFEVEHQRKDGSVFPVEIVSNYLEYDGEGYLFAQVQDISDRKRSEQSILESKAFLQTVLDTFPQSVFWKDRDSRYVGINRNFARDAGLRNTQDIVGLTDFDMPWAKTEAEDYQADDREVMQSNSPKLGIIETQVQANGKQIWLETNKLPLYDLEGNVIGVLGTYQDISDRKAAEAELQALSNRLSLALKSGDLGYWQWMIATNELYWDDRLYELHGISKDELDYSIFRDSIHPDDVDLFDELVKYAILETPYENALGQSLPYEVIYRAVCPAGVIHYLKTYGTVLRDRESEVTGMLGVTFNITHFKLVEEQLECSNQELKRANRMKDEFLATMSHELRTPLNAVLGMAEILQEKMLGDINPKQLNALNTIEKSGTHLLQLINDILDLSKISAGKTELFLNFTDVALLCHESLQLIQPQAQAKKLRILTNIESNLPPIAMDEQRIRQVLINLLSNAVKFTPDRGQITLHVESQTVPDPDRVCSPGILRITVSDTGIGIAPKDLDKLFQPFVQIDSALNRQYSGTGLGLALVKKIVELHNGQISVTSEVGIGSSFIVDLPWIAAPTAPPVNTATTPKNEDRPQVTSDQTILLVEDDPANVMTISGYLEAKGYRLVLARNGHEAIDLVQALQPRVILMDIQMPGMDGLEATQYIRQTLGLTNIPIIALTALAMDGDRKRCLEAGVTEYLSKPVKLRRLEALIKTYLS